MPDGESHMRLRTCSGRGKFKQFRKGRLGVNIRVGTCCQDENNVYMEVVVGRFIPTRSITAVFVGKQKK